MAKLASNSLYHRHGPRDRVQAQAQTILCSNSSPTKKHSVSERAHHKSKGGESNRLHSRFAKECHLRPVSGHTSITYTDEEARKHPGLRQAYQILVDAIKRPPPMAEWKERIKSRYGPNALDYKPWDVAPKNGKAKQSNTNKPLQTRRPKQVKTGSETLSLPIRTTQSPAPAPSTLQESPPTSQSSSQATSILSSQNFPQSSGTTFSSAPSRSASPNNIAGKQRGSYDPTIDIPFPDDGRFPRSHEAEDNEEEEQEEEKERKKPDPYVPPHHRCDALLTLIRRRDQFMADWMIGNPMERFPIPISAVEHRKHLMKMGIMWRNKEGKMVVHTPSFASINPHYFRFVAEFLCNTGDFSVPESQNVEEDGADGLWETYGGVWTIAVDLCLEDLLELLVRKVKALRPWPLSERFTNFVSTVYADDTLPASLDGDIHMRELISKFVAQHAHYDGFAALMKKYPVLERDVSQAKADMETKGMEMEMELERDVSQAQAEMETKGLEMEMEMD